MILEDESSKNKEMQRVELDISGMTCTSCANRIERRLNKVDGVKATVNFATERATVVFEPSSIGVDGLLKEVEAAGYEAQLPRPQRIEEEPKRITDLGKDIDSKGDTLRQRLIISGILSVPVLILSMVPYLEFRNWQWLAFAMAAPVVFYAGWPFHRAAWRNLKHHSTSMDTLVSLGSLAAFFWSFYALVFGSAGLPGFKMSFVITATVDPNHPDIYLDTAAFLVFVILLGRLLEYRGKERSAKFIADLEYDNSYDVTVLIDGQEYQRHGSELRVGDVFVVNTGDKIPTDAVVIGGEAKVDLSLLSGESQPVTIVPNDEVFGGSINVQGRIVASVTKVGSDALVGQILNTVIEAQSKKARIQRTVDKVSSVFVPVVVFVALATFVFRVAIGEGFDEALAVSIATLVVACPCALGLATPMALLVGGGRAAKFGVLIRGPEALESAGHLDVAVLDKTGTLTYGEMRVERFVAVSESFEEISILPLILAVETPSTHPVARALQRYVKRYELQDVCEVTGFESVDGLGVKGSVNGKEIVVGSFQLIKDSVPDLDVEGTLKDRFPRDLRSSLAFVVIDSVLVGYYIISDVIRTDAKEALERLRRIVPRIVILSGDSDSVVSSVANELGVSEYQSECSPWDKVNFITALLDQGERVLMIGDGTNDAGALSLSTLGVALAGGTDIAKRSGDIVVLNGGLTQAVDGVEVARKTLSTIHSNLFWAFGYNVIAIPLAVFGLVNPVIAGTAMAFSSVFVVGNSMRIFSFSPRRAEDTLGKSNIS